MEVEGGSSLINNEVHDGSDSSDPRRRQSERQNHNNTEPVMYADVQMSVDNDIETVVRKNATNVSGDNPLRYLPETQRNQLYSWLCAQLQTEREGWKRRVESALKEIERFRKNALLNDGLLQSIRERIVRVLDQAGCEVNPLARNDVDEIITKTCDICSFLIEDQSRCYALLVPSRNIENRTLSEILTEKLDDLSKEIENLKVQYENGLNLAAQRKSPTLSKDDIKSPSEESKEHSSVMAHEDEPLAVMTKEKSTLVKNTVFTFDKMSLRMLVDHSHDGPMNRARRFHEMETRIENLQDKVKIQEMELERKNREILKYKSNIRMLKRMYHYDNSTLNNSLIVKRKEQVQSQNNLINGLSVVKHLIKEEESASMSTDEILPAAAFTNARTSVSRCLRCQRLYRLQDNHKMACRYHPKGKKKFEKYTSSGRLINVVFIWDCCKKDGEQEGCCTDQHV